MTDSRAKDLIGYSFLVVFANDDTIDEEELAMLEKIALADHVIDDEERDALRRIFAHLDKDKVARRVAEEIDAFRAKYGI